MRFVLGCRLSDSEIAEVRALVHPHEVCILEPREAAVAELADADVYVPGPWNEEVFAAAKKLKWVHFVWAGLDRVLFSAVINSGVTLTNAAGAFAIPMAEHALAFILAFSRGLNVCARRRAWRETRSTIGPGLRELGGAVLGIVGYGGIGRATASRAKALGMRVLAIRSREHESDGIAEAIWGPDRLDDLLRESDYVLLSCPLNEATRGLIGARQLGQMKRTAVLINVARGAIVDQAALVAALQEGRIAGAGLDVTAPEPLPDDSPLWDMENVIITPHISAWSPCTWRYQWELMRENLARYVRGDALLNVVDKRAGY
jgi:phosphoglycerate dehydrogenase-like enzyme